MVLRCIQDAFTYIEVVRSGMKEDAANAARIWQLIKSFLEQVATRAYDRLNGNCKRCKKLNASF